MAKANNVRLLILPAHSSHITQPLDVGVFSQSGFKRSYLVDGFEATSIFPINKNKAIDRWPYLKRNGTATDDESEPDSDSDSSQQQQQHPFILIMMPRQINQ
jgi:hypothetical protein